MHTIAHRRPRLLPLVLMLFVKGKCEYSLPMHCWTGPYPDVPAVSPERALDVLCLLCLSDGGGGKHVLREISQ